MHSDSDHKHLYDAQGRQICCTLEEKINRQSDARSRKHDHSHDHGDGHDHDHDHSHDAGDRSKLMTYGPLCISLVLLLTGIALDEFLKPAFFTGIFRIVWYGLAYLPVALPVLRDAFRAIIKGEIFTEFLLMSIATVGAFCIGEYPEGVAVIVFYTIGELVQSAAVTRAQRSIKSLLDIRPTVAEVWLDGEYKQVAPDQVKTGDRIRIKAGEKVPLDGVMLSEESSFNTAALTGESKPSDIRKGETVLAGMVNQSKVAEVEVTRLFNDSSLARILAMVQDATNRKAKTEQFIRKFSKVYTPVVVALALGIVLLPYFFVSDYIFSTWLYRALIFLVISCPCALVISIPLGYFGGIGAASRSGILFKGSNFLDLMRNVNTVVMDKTGTLTKGVFSVQQVKAMGLPSEEWLPMAAALESGSTHPVAKALVEYVGDKGKSLVVDEPEEISGHGIRGRINGKTVAAGNVKLLEKLSIAVPAEILQIPDTIIVVTVDNKLAGYVTIADEIKEDSKRTIEGLHAKGIEVIMLSGDKQSVVDRVAKQLGIDRAYGDLLPEHKVQKVEAIKSDAKRVIAFAGDGINDAPVLALSDIGIAMGGLGSDAAIETADVVIQTDQPSRIVTAIDIGRKTNQIVWQNIGLAMAVKVAVLILGAGGIATMWEAVFADVGVALLAILNAVRIERIKF